MRGHPSILGGPGAFAFMASRDILEPSAGGNVGLFAAFVPITVALLGIGLVLIGGISARDSAASTAATNTVDPMATSSIATPEDRRRALEMLDR